MNQTRLYYLKFSFVSKACIFVAFLSLKSVLLQSECISGPERSALKRIGYNTRLWGPVHPLLLNSCIPIHETHIFCKEMQPQWRERLNRMYIGGSTISGNELHQQVFLRLLVCVSLHCNHCILPSPFSWGTRKIAQKLDPICKWHHSQPDFVSTISLCEFKEIRSSLVSNINIKT